MVYSNRFVACVLVNGAPQKELPNGVIPIPFGAEYSLRFRNKNDRKAVVKFTVDGDNVSGNGYIINPNSHIDIHRHFDKDAKFKFVELDSPDAVDWGKNGQNDGSKGVIEVKFYLEKPVWPNMPLNTFDWSIPSKIMLSQPPLPELIKFSSFTSSSAKADVFFSNTTTSNSLSLQDGCTVPGTASGQTFYQEYINTQEDYVGVKLVLKGINPAEFKELLSAIPSYCTNCGTKKARENDKFCGVCGNKL